MGHKPAAGTFATDRSKCHFSESADTGVSAEILASAPWASWCHTATCDPSGLCFIPAADVYSAAAIARITRPFRPFAASIVQSSASTAAALQHIHSIEWFVHQPS